LQIQNIPSMLKSRIQTAHLLVSGQFGLSGLLGNFHSTEVLI